MSRVMRRGLHLLIISAITAIFGLLTVVGVSANVGDTFTVDGAPITYKVTNDGGFPEVEVTDCQQDYKGSITLPESVVNPNDSLEYSVTSIGDYAFFHCETLKKVTIPDSVTSIGKSAFSYCASLTSVTIPESVTSIGEYAFSYCNFLNSVTIPESVTSIGNSAFEWCIRLYKVISPSCYPVTLGYNVFDSCSRNLSICIPYGTKDAYVDAGWPENELIEPSDIFTCKTLEGAYITYKVTSIYNKTVDVISVADRYYQGNLVLPETVQSNCVDYTVTGIAEKAFENCIGITSIVIPDSVTNIGKKAFYGCLSLSEVTSKSQTPAKVDSWVFVGCPSTVKIYIPKGTKEAYVAAGWPETNLV